MSNLLLVLDIDGLTFHSAYVASLEEMNAKAVREAERALKYFSILDHDRGLQHELFTGKV